MRLTLKLFASLARYLPTGSERNQVRIEVPEGTTPLQLLEQFQVPSAEVHLVLVNGKFLPPSQRTRPLQPGDELAIWPAVAGG
jgi:sulfur carrier protein ThiS